MRMTVAEKVSEEFLDFIIERYCDKLLRGTLKEKQQFLVLNELASFVPDKHGQ